MLIVKDRNAEAAVKIKNKFKISPIQDYILIFESKKQSELPYSLSTSLYYFF
jgi:hypothetical protein